MRLVAASCPCGAWVTWGSLAEPADVGAWLREHRGCASAEEAREVSRLFRRAHVVGPLLVRPRNLTADTASDT